VWQIENHGPLINPFPFTNQPMSTTVDTLSTRVETSLGLHGRELATRSLPRTAEQPLRRRATPRRRPPGGASFSLAQARLQAGEPFVAPEGNTRWAYRLGKRAIDLCGALVLLVLLAPLMLTVLVVLTITTRGRPLFVQQRVGYRGQRFQMYKFRTMRLDAERVQHLVANQQQGPIFKNRRDPRITRIGFWLRRTSIDETPQLINVLLGQMSLVGPRPPLPNEVACYQPWQRRRLAVKPGLTCLWQVSGRSDVGFEDWVRMDLWYTRHQSLATDLKLLVKTPLSVLSCRGAY
jgi:lipopolysaccharide/colanic/teichoic acid biosynthesis glycosyltransferase